MGKLSKRTQKTKKNAVKEKNIFFKTRKDIRKEKRNKKKIHKKEYFERNKLKSVGQYVKFPRDDIDSSVEKVEDTEKVDKKTFENNRLMKDSIVNKRKEKKLKHSMSEHRKSQLLKANEDEDKIIKKFEKQLKFKKSKAGAIPKSFKTDGLSYLLEVCDPNTISAAIATEKHLIDNESGSDFEEDLAIATGQKNKNDKIQKNFIKNCRVDNSDNESNDNLELYNEDLDIDDDSDNLGMYEDDIGEKDEEGSFSSNRSDADFENLLEDSSSDECLPKFAKKHKSKGKSIAKCMSNEADTTSEEEFDETFHNGELTEEELEMLYTGASSFPDGVYRPENLTPIREETESDIKLYKSGVELKSIKSECIDKESVDDSEESYTDHLSEDSFMVESDNSECDDCVLSSNESESENKKTIVINGKVINTYGRELAPKIEDDIIRCPQLDKILASISDSEAEPDKSHLIKNISKSSATSTYSSNNVENKSKKKRKILLNDKSDVSGAKKLCKSSKETSSNEKCSKVKNISIEFTSKNKKLTENIESDDSDESNNDLFESGVDSQSESDGNDGHLDNIWEDIYGRKRDKSGKILDENNMKYVPPHLRKLENNIESAEMQQLKRQIKSLLNKVAGSNMHWISSQLELIYNSNSRHSVNSCFSSLWMGAVVQPVMISDRLAIEHSVLVAILHANVGSEIGAFFLQAIVKKFDELLRIEQKLENKELDNLILGISQLYNFKVFHTSLLYEILKKFVNNLSEKYIDCVLVVLRNVGGVLRKEDPTALKLFIQNAHEKSACLKNSTSGSRVNFLLDVLLAIKNNNMNKIPNYDTSYSEEMKKSMKAILRRGNTVVPLNIKLEDLLNSDKRGKWWIVGSAWEHSLEKPNIKKKKENLPQSHLLKLADKQRINTDLRRNIFCIIMSAEDYVDAFEKLQHLGLKQQQEREIINILMVCCLQEKEYNPYYSVLAQRFCDYDRKFQMSIQYNVWDKLKDLDSCSMFQITNLAQFLTHLFIEKGLAISVLKVVQFAELSKPTLRLMRQILLGVLLHKNPQKILEVFQRVAVSPKLHLFRESLRLFISHFLLKSPKMNEDSLSDEKTTLLKERAGSVDRILQSDSKLEF